MKKAKTNETEKPMTNEEVENVANYLRRLTAQARARAAMISPWLVFEVGRFGCYFRGRIESTLNLPARGVWFSVDARIVGSKGDDFERVIESQIATVSYAGTPAEIAAMASTLSAISAAVADLEAIAREFVRVSKTSKTHATILANVLDECEARS